MFAGSRAEHYPLVGRYDKDQEGSCESGTTFSTQRMSGLVAEPLSRYCSCSTRPDDRGQVALHSGKWKMFLSSQDRGEPDVVLAQTGAETQSWEHSLSIFPLSLSHS